MISIRLINEIILIILYTSFVSAIYENNPYLVTNKEIVSSSPPRHSIDEQSNKLKQTIQQFQFAVVVPPNSSDTSKPLSEAQPGYVWVQIPISSHPPSQIQQQLPVNKPAHPPNTTPAYGPGIQQPTQPSNVNGVNVSTVQLSTEVDTTLKKKCLKPRGQFPSDSCNKFVNCWDDVVVEQACLDGLLFHPKGYCDYPANVDCNGKPIVGLPPIIASTTSESTPSGSSPLSSTPTLIFNSTTSLPPTISTLPAVDPSLQKKCLKPRGQFPSKTCNKYVNCWDGVIIEQECPEGLLFSVKGHCDYPHNVNCENRIPTRTNEIIKECPRLYGTFRDELNCNLYFTCVDGKIAAKYQCPEGFSFNDNIGVCDYAERVDCSHKPLIFDPKSNFITSLPHDIMDQIDKCKSGSIIRLNPQCTAACLCRDGLSEIVQCPAGLAYDSKTDKCLLPDLAKC